MTKQSILAALAVLAITVPSFVHAAEPTTKPSYPITKDVVTGEPLPANGGIVENIDGREVHFASQINADSFKTGGEAMHKKLDDAIVEAQKPLYKDDTCPVSDEKLGEMGKPFVYVDRASNTMVELCCKSCVKKMKSDPAAAAEAVKKVDEANAKG